MMKRGVSWMAVLAAVLGMAAAPGASFGQKEMSIESPWYFSPGLGQIQYEGDEEVEDGFILTGRLGYDYTEMWGLELMAYVAPELDINTRNSYGEVIPRVADVSDTYALGLAIDGLFHFTRWERLDPFLALGAGFIWYGDEVNGEDFDPAMRGGGGVMYHFNDEWGVRADARMFFAGNDTEANMTIDGGLIWNWGARLGPDYAAVGGPKDSDGDGLPDEEEAQWGTDPFDADSDDDGLTDGEEVYTFKTDPLNPDSDSDALKDGEEAYKFKTNPLDRDTDDGGVADGHEVIEDGTDPLNGTDDLILFELYLQFDYDKAVIKPQYFPKLDVIARVMQRDAGAAARIEGHADKNRKSRAEYNKALSKRRADAVRSYLMDPGAIAGNRMEAHGYGFDRPKAPNGPDGNPDNRRVEVYIRPSTPEGRAAILETRAADVAAP